MHENFDEQSGDIAVLNWINHREKGTKSWRSYTDSYAQSKAARMGSKNSGDISTISFEHECGEIIKLDIDLSKVEVVQNKNSSDLVEITDEIMVRLSPPGIDDVIGTENKNQIDLVMEIIRDSIVEIIQGEDVFSAQDHTREELEEFLDSLNSGQFKKLQDYYESLPKMKQDIEYTCEKCGKTETETLEGLASFFASA